uniref:Uncharacterized protein n=1 Tax=Parascaris equorum TaxID=6256 RepID=A0A914RCB4_PAREQ
MCSTFERLFANYAACKMEMSACCHNVCLHVRSTIFIKYITSPAVVALLLAWPLEEISDRAIALKKLIANAIKNFDFCSDNEIGLLRTQIEVISAECTESDASKRTNVSHSASRCLCGEGDNENDGEDRSNDKRSLRGREKGEGDIK